MRILIQDPASRAYFDGQSWSADLVSAMDFESTSVAERFCLDHNFSAAVIVVKFKDDNTDIRFRAGSRNTLLTSYGQEPNINGRTAA